MKRYRQRILVVLTAAGAALYFAHHAIYGGHGFEARKALLDRMAVARSKLSGLEAVRVDLRRDISLLGADQPDADIVEELARGTLGFGYRSERVLIAVDDPGR